MYKYFCCFCRKKETLLNESLSDDNLSQASTVVANHDK
jgi:hypothetical protein